MFHAIVHVFRDMRQYKVRSLITLSGAMWGVMILVGIYAPVRAFDRECSVIFERAGGTHQLVIDLGTRKLDSVPGVVALLPRELATLTVIENLWWYHDAARDPRWEEQRISSTWGVPPEFLRFFGFTLAAGRPFCDLDGALENRVCLVGGDVRVGEARGADLVGRQLSLAGARLTVVGVLEPVVHPEWEAVRYDLLGLSGGFPDHYVFVPLGTAPRIAGGRLRLRVHVPERQDLDATLRRLRVLLPKDQIGTASILDTYREVKRILDKWKRGLWVVIAICLLMSGIGLAVLMLSSVHLRLKEIGVRKAVGASNLDIALQFLIETSVLSSLGGVAGVGAGLMVGRVACDLIGFPFWADPGVILAGFASSVVLGIVFGTVPAAIAARMSPVEALRSE